MRILNWRIRNQRGSNRKLETRNWKLDSDFPAVLIKTFSSRINSSISRAKGPTAVVKSRSGSFQFPVSSFGSQQGGSPQLSKWSGGKRFILICLLGILPCIPAWAGQPSSFEVVLQHYEPIRLALLADSMDGVSNNGKAIAEELRHLQADFSDRRVGASGEVAKTVQEHLPAMIAAADAMAKAKSLEPARNAFYDLSKPLVRWREGVAEGERPSVAYCPMYKRSWLQPGTEIGNPYGGMPRCGQIVSK